MNTLKQVIHYQDTNSVEATWVDERGVVVRCHSYDQYQMEMLVDDLGAADAPVYRDVIAAVLAAQTPLPEPVIEIPQRVTNYQAKVALDAWQLLDEIEAYMAGEDTPKRYKLAWDSASFERQSDMVLGIAELFGLTSEQVDQLFVIASNVS